MGKSQSNRTGTCIDKMAWLPPALGVWIGPCNDQLFPSVFGVQPCGLWGSTPFGTFRDNDFVGCVYELLSIYRNLSLPSCIG